MASIIKRKSRYSVVYTYEDENGNKRQKWETFDTHAAAKKRKVQVEYEQENGSFVVPEAKTVSELLEEYVSVYGVNTWAMSTYEAKKSLIYNYINPMIGDMQLKEITPRTMDKFYQSLLSVKSKVVNNRKPANEYLTPHTVREIHKLLRTAFNQAVKWELMSRNPVENATLPKVTYAERDIWTAETLFKALSVCDDPDLSLAINLAFSCSLRIGEMLALTWDCIDISEKSINSGYASVFVNKELQRVNRQALEQLLQERTERKPVSFSAVSYPPVQTRSAKRPKYCRARFTNGNIPDAFLDCELIYVPMTLSNQALESLMDRGFAVAVEIPRGMFGIEDKLYRRLQEIKALGITEVLASNLGAVELARALDMDIHGGFGLNITNTAAIEQAQRWGLMDVEVSFELTLAQIAALGGKLPIGIIAGGRLPLMLTRNHPADNAKGTQRDPFLQDRKGMRFPLQRYGSCTEVLNSVPLTLSDRQQEMAGIDFTVLRFSVENSVEMGEILTVFNRKLPLKPPITRGLYYRGVE